MKLKSRICEMLGIDYPIFQGGMAWVSEARLAAAVSNAGGLGIISAMNADADYLRKQIDLCRELTDKPFGVNIMLLSPFVEEVAALVAEKKVPVVTTGAGNAGKYIPMWKEAGIKVIPVVPSVALAKRAEAAGASAVIAEGGESGGHVGDLTTITLVPQVADAVSIPVIAAGGIADGRGMAVAFLLGAEGIQCGTRFLSAEECQIHENYKKKIVAASDTDTMVTGHRSGHPVRALKTPFTRKFAKMEYEVSQEELNQFGSGALRRASQEGDNEMGCFMAGQSAGMVHAIQPAAEIVRDYVEGCIRVLESATGHIK
ncbi:MAG: enoyl-[acyl-carrier-protein] reductase FabK [Paludibacteraceae bacterium]|nr:enoyl-[acyl-carrier-protein] reductase FabK [Paludibacteraceae bacterium]